MKKEKGEKKGKPNIHILCSTNCQIFTLLTHQPWPTPRHSHLFPVKSFQVKSHIIKDNEPSHSRKKKKKLQTEFTTGPRAK